MGNSCSVVNTYVAELRDVNVQTDRMRFRRNLELYKKWNGFDGGKFHQFLGREGTQVLDVLLANLLG